MSEIVSAMKKISIMQQEKRFSWYFKTISTVPCVKSGCIDSSASLLVVL